MAPNPLENLLADAVPGMLSAAGTAASYTPAGGEAKAITVILGPANDQWDSAEELERGVRRRDCTVSRDSETGIANPAVGDQLTLGGVEYAVEAIAELASATAMLRLVSVDQRRVADPGLHPRRP